VKAETALDAPQAAEGVGQPGQRADRLAPQREGRLRDPRHDRPRRDIRVGPQLRGHDRAVTDRLVARGSDLAAGHQPRSDLRAPREPGLRCNHRVRADLAAVPHLDEVVELRACAWRIPIFPENRRFARLAPEGDLP
jgi:hypothetical protein